MKRNLLSIILTILMSMVGTKTWAYDFAVENVDGVTICYEYINDGTELEVVGAKDVDVLAIPEEVTYMNRTRKVTSIGERAFQFYGFSSVILPKSLKSIRYQAFQYCQSLASANIPDSVTDIGEEAFMECTALTSITIGNSVTSIGQSAFAGCIALASVTIGNRVTSIERYTFYRCVALISITMPNSVAKIGEGAFNYCIGLTSVTLSNTVTDIDNYAFQDCKSLTTITIPNSVTSIGYRVFSGCDFAEVISNIENPFAIYSDVFSNNTFYNATLYVPKGTVDKYKTADGWKKFVYIEEGNGTNPSETQKCANPSISYSNGKLTFNCDTEGAVCQSSITDSDITSYSSNEVQLGVTYNISVYATKAGYENSETVTATLCWVDVDPKTEGISNGVASVRANAVLIQSNNGNVSVTGVDNGADVSVYSISGQMLGTAKASGNQISLPTNLNRGEIAIIKIGEKAVKVVMQ